MNVTTWLCLSVATWSYRLTKHAALCKRFAAAQCACCIADRSKEGRLALHSIIYYFPPRKTKR